MASPPDRSRSLADLLMPGDRGDRLRVRKAPRGRMDEAYHPWDEIYRAPPDALPINGGVYRTPSTTLWDLLADPYNKGWDGNRTNTFYTTY